MFRSILLIDDHAAILEGLRNLLVARYPDARFRTAASASEGRLLLSREEPDLIILDLSIGQDSGLEFMSTIRKKVPAARVVVYSLHPESELGLAALRAGAHAYVTKDRPIADLMEALRRVETGRRYIGSHLAESLADAVTTEPSENPDRPLSDREFQILRMLAAGKAQKEIAGELGVSVKTVSTYRARILEKLGLSTTADLIKYAVAQKL